MNQFLAERFVENIRRLALGLEPIDACRRSLAAHALAVDFDNELFRKRQHAFAAAETARIEPRRSNRYVLMFHPSITNSIDIRLRDASRRFVSRRLRIPIRSQAVADSFPGTDRVRRPFLFPGAAYDVASGTTGVRGRVLRGSSLGRWARIEALRAGNVIARAHGDDRGEFLLLLDSSAAPAGDLDLTQPFQLNVIARLPLAAPVPNPAGIEKRDPLWDLPVELPESINDPDPVRPEDRMFRGEVNPPGYDGSVSVAVDFRHGQVISGITFTF